MPHHMRLISTIVIGLVLAFVLGPLPSASASPLVGYLLAGVLVGKSLAAYAIVRLVRHPDSTAPTIAASLARIGAFSFVLAGLGAELQLLPEQDATSSRRHRAEAGPGSRQ